MSVCCVGGGISCCGNLCVCHWGRHRSWSLTWIVWRSERKTMGTDCGKIADVYLPMGVVYYKRKILACSTLESLLQTKTWLVV